MLMLLALMLQSGMKGISRLTLSCRCKRETVAYVSMKQYYSTLLSLLSGKTLRYHVDERRDWTKDVRMMRLRSLCEGGSVAVAKKQGLRPNLNAVGATYYSTMLATSDQSRTVFW
eukprot:120037-Rhodomonas_salina.3